MPRRKEFPYVKVDKKTGCRQLRKPGLPLTTLPPLGSPKSEFKAAYDAALACKPLEIEIGASRTNPAIDQRTYYNLLCVGGFQAIKK